MNASEKKDTSGLKRNAHEPARIPLTSNRRHYRLPVHRLVCLGAGGRAWVDSGMAITLYCATPDRPRDTRLYYLENDNGELLASAYGLDQFRLLEEIITRPDFCFYEWLNYLLQYQQVLLQLFEAGYPISRWSVVEWPATPEFHSPPQSPANSGGTKPGGGSASVYSAVWSRP